MEQKKTHPDVQLSVDRFTSYDPTPTPIMPPPVLSKPPAPPAKGGNSMFVNNWTSMDISCPPLFLGGEAFNGGSWDDNGANDPGNTTIWPGTLDKSFPSLWGGPILPPSQSNSASTLFGQDPSTYLHQSQSLDA